MSDFRVNDAERTSPLWQAMRRHYEARLAHLRQQNDTRKSPEDTAWVRGQIEEVKALLRLDEPPREVPRD